MRQLSEEGKESYPLASHILLNDTYVDDIISGASTIENVRSLQEQLTMLLREGRFEAHKWYSNSDDALKEVPHEFCESNFSFKIDANDTIRALA